MVGPIPLRMVEGIERLQPQLQPHLFAEFEVLEQGHVPVIDSRPTQDVPARGANHACVGLRECRRIKPLRDTLVKSRVWISDQIGPIIEIVEGTSLILGVDRVGETSLESYNPVQLPAASNEIPRPADAGKILSASAKSQVVDEAGNQAMVHIEIRPRVLQPGIVIVDKSLPARIGAANAGGCGFVVDALGPGVSRCEQQSARTMLQ